MMKLIAAGTLALVLCAHAPVLAQTASPAPKQTFVMMLLPLPGAHVTTGALETVPATPGLTTPGLTTPGLTTPGLTTPGPLAPVPGTQPPATRALIMKPDTMPTALIPTMVPTQEGAPPVTPPRKSGIRRP